MWINDVAGSQSDCPVDIVFVVDESTSIGSSNFEKVKTFMSDLVGGMDIDSGNTRVGVVPYSNDVDFATAFDLDDHSTVADVQTAIAALTWGGWFPLAYTYTNEALEYVRTTTLTPPGDRPDVPNVVVVITDGASTEPSATEVCAVWKLMKKLPYSRNYLNLCCLSLVGACGIKSSCNNIVCIGVRANFV